MLVDFRVNVMVLVDLGAQLLLLVGYSGSGRSSRCRVLLSRSQALRGYRLDVTMLVMRSIAVALMG